MIKMKGKLSQLLLLALFNYSLRANGIKIFLVTLFGTLVPKL
jgi:hypothetical protein